MLELVHDMTSKSWVGFTGPDERFTKRNLIFGHNGRGKSALALGIVKEAISQGASQDSVHLFDRDYVQREMRLSQSDGIRGVKVAFGRENVTADADLKSAKDDLGNAELSLKSTDEEMKAASNIVTQRVSDIFTATKGSASIKAKRSNLSAEELVEAWDTDYRAAISKYPDYDYGSHVGDNSTEVKIGLLRETCPPSIPQFDIGECEVAVDVLRKSYKSIDIPSATVVSWMEEGVRLSEGRERCLFCGAPMVLEEIRDRVEGYRRNEEIKAQHLLGRFAKHINDLSHFVEDARSRGKRACPLLQSCDVDADLVNWLGSDVSDYERASGLVFEKISDMDSSLDVSASDFDFIKRDLELADRLRNLISSEISKLENILENSATITKGSIGFKVKSDKTIDDALARIRSANETIVSLNERIDSLKKRIRDIEASRTDVAAFAEYLSAVLGDLGFPFSLETHPSGYYLLTLTETDAGKRLSLSDISEGERNLLALLYFFFTLFDDDEQQNLAEAVEMVVIDDPISSMDGSNRFYVLEILRHIMQTDAQIFIFTHSWDDFCELAYKRSDDTSLFEVVKRNGISALRPCGDTISPYRKLFKEIYNFSQMDPSDASFEEIAIHMPNDMRRVLERYLSFNCGVSSIGSGNVRAIAEALYPNKSWAKLSTKQRSSMSLLLSVTNLLSHKIGESYNASTVQDCAKYLMSRIENANRRHYIAMKQ